MSHKKLNQSQNPVISDINNFKVINYAVLYLFKAIFNLYLFKHIDFKKNLKINSEWLLRTINHMEKNNNL